MGRRRASTKADAADDGGLVTIDVLTDVSGNGWALAKGSRQCGPRRAKMLIGRGYARAVGQQEGEGGE